MQHKSHKTDKSTIITVKDLRISYGDFLVLDNLSFSIKKNSITALIGPNGSGKTTLIKALLGLEQIDKGEIFIDSHKIGYVPQRFQFDHDFPLTVTEFMGLVLKKGCDSICIEKKLKEVGLSRDVYKKTIGSLSGGQLQRVLIAQAVLNDPEIIFLDEPSTGIDIVGEIAFLNILKHLQKEHKTTIVLVSHDISMVHQIVDSVICINKKLLCHGPPEKALTERKLEELYGEESKLFKHHCH